jgi:hypothetical protein
VNPGRWLAGELRQRGQHRAFRIAAPAQDWPRLRQALAELAELADSPVSTWDESAAVELGNSLWRARHKLAQVADTSQHARQAGRHLDRAEQALADTGVVIQDHDGSAYHPGLSLEVVATVNDTIPDAAIVVETIRPSIYLSDRRIQMGQVVVGGPVSQDKEETRARHD